MSEIMEKPTAEEVARHYSGCQDVISLINGYVAGKYGDQDIEKNEESIATVERNVGHLLIMVDKDFMQDQDLAPLRAAIAAGQAYIA